MARTPKPWWRKDRRSWFVTINGKRHDLGPDREVAFRCFHNLMAQPTQKQMPAESVAAIVDAFLEWTQNHRADATYGWYLQRCQWFMDSIPNLSVVQLKPFHVQQWVDAHPNWSDGHKRGCIIAVQRAFRWAQKMGHIDKNPIAYIEKPKPGKRDQIVSPDQFQINSRSMLSNVRDCEFHDLLTTAWESGSRPQELLRVEARHVDLKNSRWVFAPKEAKIKTRPRIVYLLVKALEITQRIMLKWPEGPIFRNTQGRPWTPFAVKCRFDRLHKKIGEKFCLYAFRHSFATRLLEAGVDALTVATLLGHADVSMLGKVYQHLSHNPKRLLDEANKAAS